MIKFSVIPDREILNLISACPASCMIIIGFHLARSGAPYTDDRGQKTEDGRQMTDVRGQKADDRGQTTDDRGQMAGKSSVIGYQLIANN